MDRQRDREIDMHTFQSLSENLSHTKSISVAVIVLLLLLLLVIVVLAAAAATTTVAALAVAQ